MYVKSSHFFKFLLTGLTKTEDSLFFSPSFSVNFYFKENQRTKISSLTDFSK